MRLYHNCEKSWRNRNYRKAREELKQEIHLGYCGIAVVIGSIFVVGLTFICL